MKRFLTDRVDAFGALGQAAVDLLRAESAALRTDLQGSARRLLGAVLLLVVALFVVFWTLGALIFSLVEIGALWLPRWGAALVVTALLALVAAVLSLVARWRLKRLETPAATLRRRAGEYQEWWERRMGEAPGGGLSAAEAGPVAEESSPRPDA